MARTGFTSHSEERSDEESRIEILRYAQDDRPYGTTSRRPFLLILGGISLFLLTGMAAGDLSGRQAELRPEIRLKLYSEAISHYEKAQSLQAQGKLEQALKELRKATGILRAFPEAYDLAGKIFQAQGKLDEARKQQDLFKQYGGHQGASLYKLRKAVSEEVLLRKKSAPPPDVRLLSALFGSGTAVAVLIFLMVWEYKRLTGSDEVKRQTKIFLDHFPDEAQEITPSFLFKICGLLLPAPFLFSLLVGLGFQTYSDILPVFLLTWAVVAIAVYVLFFADLTDLGSFRRPR